MVEYIDPDFNEPRAKENRNCLEFLQRVSTNLPSFFLEQIRTGGIDFSTPGNRGVTLFSLPVKKHAHSAIGITCLV
jgi:hypothetical protein